MNSVHIQTDMHNKRMRQVKNVYRYSYDKFLKRVNGNMLINGGNEAVRRRHLLSYIEKVRAEGDQTVFIFSDDAELENELIDRAAIGSIGQLHVCSQTHNYYDFFRDMKPNLVTEYFNCLAVEKAVKDTSEIISYSDAFLSILSDQADVNMSALKRFAVNDDKSISGAAKNSEDASMILSSSKGGVTFRSLLNRTYSALLPLTSKDCGSGFCLKNLVDEDCVVLINTPFDNYEFFSLYFAMELKSLIGERFVCIFDDSIMLNNKVMRSIVEILKQRPQISVVVSHENIISVDDGESLMKNFNCDLIFLNGETPHNDLQKVLSSFGQYTHMQPMSHKTSAPKIFFTPFSSDGEAAVSYQRDRVILQEEFGNEALLKDGKSAEITITKILCE